MAMASASASSNPFLSIIIILTIILITIIMLTPQRHQDNTASKANAAQTSLDVAATGSKFKPYEAHEAYALKRNASGSDQLRGGGLELLEPCGAWKTQLRSVD